MRLAFIATVAAIIVGCSSSRQARNDLQPFVAATGYYGLLSSPSRPSPAPAPAGCTKGCRCNGTGEEKSGDGISMVSCRCPGTCPCKTKKATKCPNGACGWPPRNITP